MNALWSIYVRRYLRLSRWEWWQLGLGLCIPLLLMLHVTSTRIAESLLGVTSHYSSVLIVQWLLSPWLAVLQVTAVLTVWIHACIGVHFWLRTKAWYARWRALFVGVGLLLPTLALSGYVTAGNQVLRAAANPDYTRLSLEAFQPDGPEEGARLARSRGAGSAAYLALTLLPFVGRGVRGWLYRRRRPPLLTHSSGRTVPILPGATVLETLRENGIPHASVCGGRARCTTCRILVTKGLDQLPEPSGLEARALARIGATPGMRLACQICPTADISVMPLLAADAGAADGTVRGGLEGSERLITVLFVDLRGSTTLGEAKMPYDLLFILNQFFHEMTKALDATNGHYAQFAGDGLMALYGLNAQGPRDRRRRRVARSARNVGAHRPAQQPLEGRLAAAAADRHWHPFRRGHCRCDGTASVADHLRHWRHREHVRASGEPDQGIRLPGHRLAARGRNGRPRRQRPQAAAGIVNGVAQPVEFYALNTLADLRV